MPGYLNKITLIGLLLIAIVTSALAESWVRVFGEIPAEKVISMDLDTDSIRVNGSRNAEYKCRTRFSSTTSIIISTVEMTSDGKRRNLSVSFLDANGRLLATERPGGNNELNWNWGEAETGDKEFALVSTQVGWNAEPSQSASQGDRWVTYSSNGNTGTWSYDKESLSWLNGSTLRVWVRNETGFKMVYTLYADRTYESADAFGNGTGKRLPVQPDSPNERLWKKAFRKG